MVIPGRDRALSIGATSRRTQACDGRHDSRRDVECKKARSAQTDAVSQQAAQHGASEHESGHRDEAARTPPFQMPLLAEEDRHEGVAEDVADQESYPGTDQGCNYGAHDGGSLRA